MEPAQFLAEMKERMDMASEEAADSTRMAVDGLRHAG